MVRFKYLLFFIALLYSESLFAQATHVITDREKEYKTLQEYMTREDYGLAYPLATSLRTRIVEAYTPDPAYLQEDIDYFYIICALMLNHSSAKEEAMNYITKAANQPRAAALSYYLAHAYYNEGDFEQALIYYDKAGIDNLSNEMLADLKFEKGYSLFNLKRFSEAKPLFNEIHQLENSKYFIPANYYYGFISYYDKDYEEALNAFKTVELSPEYAGVVPYYITEIYYFRGEKDLALSYGENILKRTESLYYSAQLKLLLGQIYFEKKDFKKALPLLEAFVQQNQKVTKEVLYALSYSYYENGMYEPAINGFKDLSSESDSLGQNSMYLLGDLYLQTDQKANARAAFQFGANNSSNKIQQKVSLFNYAKLSYELGYEDLALKEMKNFLSMFAGSNYDKEAKEILVDLLARTNNYREALELYNSFESPTPAMLKVLPRINYGRAIELINDQDLVQANSLLTQVIGDRNAGSTLPFAFFWKGELAYRLKNYTEAVNYYTKYLDTKAPVSGEANPATAKYGLAYSLFQLENYTKATTLFEDISTGKDNISTDALVRTADGYYMQRNYAKALSIYDQVISRNHPQADYAYYQKGMIAGIKSGKDKISILDKLAVTYPTSNLLQEANMEIAMAYIADENFQAAIPFLAKILRSNSEGLKPRAFLKTGLAYYNGNDNTNALIAYKSLLAAYPQSTEADEAVSIIKDIYIEEGNPGGYITLMNSSGRNVSAKEADSLTYSSAAARLANNDCNGAIAAFKSYISEFPQGNHRAEANYRIATCYTKTKDYTNATVYYRNTIDLGLSKYFEAALLEDARIQFFDLKNYQLARERFTTLRKYTYNQDNQLEALRGLVRTNYYLKDYTGANEAAAALIKTKGINTDDKAVGNLVLGKSKQIEGNCIEAIPAFTAVAALNKAAWGAEARYEIANCQFEMSNYKAAEKAALSVIKETGSYDEWVTRSYLLLGDIFMQEKDYFNAKATFESVSKNAAIPELKKLAAEKLEAAIAAEKTTSKINTP